MLCAALVNAVLPLHGTSHRSAFEPPHSRFGAVTIGPAAVSTNNDRKLVFGACGPCGRRSQLQRAQAVQRDLSIKEGSRYIVRRCRPGDVEQVAAICAEVFGKGNFENAADNELIRQLEESYAESIRQKLGASLTEALERKAQASREARELNLYRQTQLLRAQLAAARAGAGGGRVQSPRSPDNRALWEAQERLRRARLLMCLVAAEEHSGQVAGCVTLALGQPEALLPPPLPSTAPLRAYLSNMAVMHEHRRRGVARALLRECERVAVRWRQRALMLHVQCGNAPAVALYAEGGYQRAQGWGGLKGVSTLLLGPKREVLMWRQLSIRAAPRRSSTGSAEQKGASNGEGVLGAARQDGVYVWGAGDAAAPALPRDAATVAGAGVVGLSEPHLSTTGEEEPAAAPRSGGVSSGR